VTAFRFTLDPASSTPKNEQLTQQVQDAVKAGTLAAGTKLPTVRALAAELDVAPYTIARAYRQLEDLGVIETHGRNGTIVSTFGDTTQQQAQLAARDFAERMRGLGVEPAEALALAKAALQSGQG
jgi:DNA-binding transcriptional regulator YhcF (GntR family)